MKSHDRSCPAYGNYQPPYEGCDCGAEDRYSIERIGHTLHVIDGDYGCCVVCIKDATKIDQALKEMCQLLNAACKK